MKVFMLQNMPPIKLRLFHSRSKMQKEIDKSKFHFEPSSSKAQTCILEQDGETYCFVLLEFYENNPQVMALLVHESVHVAQAYWGEIGEDKPSSEFMAYTIQSIAQYLMEEHADWYERHKRS